MEKEIIKLLEKISEQLEGVAQAQDQIKAQIHLLHAELADFEEFTLRRLKAKLKNISLQTLVH